jgi:hypothetical protein
MLERVPFRSIDVSRVTEFFEGDENAAYTLARDIWLPETVLTLWRLYGVVLSHGDDLLFLCDHLREGSRVVGAWFYEKIADDIALAYTEGSCEACLHLISEGLARSVDVLQWLNQHSSTSDEETTVIDPQALPVPVA